MSLAGSGPRATRRERVRVIAAAAEDAALVLGNTAAIARKSYIGPRLIDRYEAGETMDPDKRSSPEFRLRALLLD